MEKAKVIRELIRLAFKMVKFYGKLLIPNGIAVGVK